MKKVAILACEKMRQKNLCAACTKCFVSLSRLDGKFALHQDDVILLGIMDCGGCPGDMVIPSLSVLKSQLEHFKEDIEALHIGTCIMKYCPYKDEIIKTLKEKAGVEVIEGTHEYGGATVFGK